MLPEPALRFSSIDMTLALGAESFLEYRRNPVRGLDPSGESAFVNMVDLVINSDVCFLTWPSNEDYPYRPELLERLPSIKEIPNCASVRLKHSKEERVFKSFWSVFEAFGYQWFAQWWNSHFADPVVIKHHLPRLGNRARKLTTISDVGFAMWSEFITARRLKRLQPLGDLPKNAPHIVSDAKRFKGIAAYQYCYAYDVFRRGWQYAQATRLKNLDIKYCPHQLRQRALSGASDAWIEQARRRHWSWGRCIAHIVKTNPDPVPIGRITDWVNGLIPAKPKWAEIPQLSSSGSEIEYRKTLDCLIESLRVAARSAKIPRNRVRPLAFAAKVGRLSIEEVLEETKLGTVHAVIEMLPASKILDSVTFQVSETVKDAVNLFQTGTFDYPGLLNPEMEAYSRQMKREVILI
jgi:hypothetical protein